MLVLDLSGFDDDDGLELKVIRHVTGSFDFCFDDGICLRG